MYAKPDFNPDLLDTAIEKCSVGLMKQEYISYWKNTLQHSQKLEIYRSLKTDHTTERRALEKLRIRNQKLMIELGR